jgi:hypothetical protein
MPSATTSNYLHIKQMDYFLKGVAWTPPSSLWVALFITVPALDNTGGTEVTASAGTNYSRVQVLPSHWSSGGTANLEYSNNIDIIFNVPGNTSWGTITGCGLYDATTGGNLFCVAYLTTNKSVSSGDGAPKIQASQLRLARATC